MTESTPAPTRAAAFSGSMSRAQTDLGEGDEQRQGGRGEQGHLEPPHGEVVPVEEQGGQAAHDEAGRRRQAAAAGVSAID